MGYESRLFIMNRNECKRKSGKIWVYAEKLAVIDMSCMGHNNGWKELFTEEIDYKIFTDGENEEDTDDYGEHLKSGKIENIIRWLEEQIDNGNNYRRLKPLLGFLKEFNAERWDELQIVHYGY